MHGGTSRRGHAHPAYVHGERSADVIEAHRQFRGEIRDVFAGIDRAIRLEDREARRQWRRSRFWPDEVD